MEAGLPAGGVVVFALVVSLAGIGVPGLWFDEVATLAASQRSWDALGRMLTDVDAVHAAYYALMHVWLGVVGYTPALLRVPSALAVAATAGVVAEVARRLWGRAAAIVAGAAFVVLPRTVWMAIEARSFAMATLFLSLGVLFMLRALTTGLRRYWVANTVVTAVACVLFFYCYLALPALWVAAGWQMRAQRRPLGPLVASSAAGVLPALPVALMAIGQRGQVSWIPLVGPGDVVALPRVFLGGFLGDLFPMRIVVVSSLALVLAVAVALWGLVERLRSASGEAGSEGRSGVRGEPGESASLGGGPLAVLMLGWAGLPALALLAAGTVLPLYDPKYCAISAPALALVVGAGLTGLLDARRSVMRAVCAALAAVALGGLGVQYWAAIRQPDAKGDVLAVARTVGAVKRPGDGLWIQHDSLARVARYAYPDDFAGMRDLTLDRDLEGSPTLWETEIPIADAGLRLAGVRRVIGVSLTARDASDELATLTRRGFREDGVRDVGDYRVWILERRS